MTSILLALFVAIGLAWFFLKPDKPVPNEPLTEPLIRALLEFLLYRGVANRAISPTRWGGLTIHVRDDPRRMELSKYLDAKGQSGIRLELPGEPWTARYVEPFREELQRRGIAFVEEPSYDAQDPPTMRLDVGHDLGLAQLILVILFEHVFGVRLARDCVGLFNQHILAFEVPRLSGARKTRA